MYAVTAETPPSLQARHTHFRSHREKPRDVGRQGTPLYVVTVETNRMYKPVYCNFLVVTTVIVKTRKIYMYVYYTIRTAFGL
jgi:hypothetical protein